MGGRGGGQPCFSGLGEGFRVCEKGGGGGATLLST